MLAALAATKVMLGGNVWAATSMLDSIRDRAPGWDRSPAQCIESRSRCVAVWTACGGLVVHGTPLRTCKASHMLNILEYKKMHDGFVEDPSSTRHEPITAKVISDCETLKDATWAIGPISRHCYQSRESQQWSSRYALLKGATLIDSSHVSIMRGCLPGTG
jgi:hypothetical protein